MTDKANAGQRVAIAPLTGNKPGLDQHWLGWTLGKLLHDHLRDAGLPVVDYNVTCETLNELDKSLPLDTADALAVARRLEVATLVTGDFAHKDEQLSITLQDVTSGGQTRPPLTREGPGAEFGELIEQTTLALIQHVGQTLNDTLRKKVTDMPRPRHFNAFEQLSLAYMSWADEDYERALKRVGAALALESTLEEAGQVQIGVAYAAGDNDALRAGFSLWAGLAARNGRPLVRAGRLLVFGHWLLAQGEWNEAEDTYRAALDVYEQHKSKLGEAHALDNLAGLALRRGKVVEAGEAFRRSIAYYEAEGRRLDEAIATYHLGLCYKAQQQPERALVTLNQASKLARDNGSQQVEAAALDQRGTLQAAAGDPSSAEKDFRAALALYEEVGDSVGIAIVKDHLAALLAERGELAAAEALRLEAGALLEGQDASQEQAVLWANLALLYRDMNNPRQSQDYARQAHAVFTRLESDQKGFTRRLLAEGKREEK